MTDNLAWKGYVQRDDEKWYIQLPDDDGGFTLCDDDQSWPGGFPGHSWRAIPLADVPADVRIRLDWIIDEYEANAKG